MNLVIDSVFSTTRNGICFDEEYPSCYSPDLQEKLSNVSCIPEMVQIFRNLLTSANSIYVSLLIHFHYISDDVNTTRHLVVTPLGWTYSVHRDFITRDKQ